VFKKFITLMMVFALFTVHANATSQQGLKAAFDELNYSLTVEWDQKDKAFYAEQMKKFSATIREYQAMGMTNSQLIDFVKKEVKNERLAKDLETAFNMISINKMSPAEANNYVLELMKKSYSTGASWNGDAGTIILISLVIVLVAIAIASGSSVVVSGGTCWYEDVYVCDTYCYNDWWYGYSCYNNYCYWTTQRYCY
jgi:hypothetical protein